MPTSLLANLTLENADPPWLWTIVIVAAVALLVATYRGIYQRSSQRLAWGLLTLRVIGVLALFVALLKPAWVTFETRQERPAVVVVLDDSQSMGLPATDDAGTRYQQATRWLDESEAGQWLQSQFDVDLLDLTGQPLEPGSLPDEPNAEQTDLIRALAAARARLRGRHARGVLLISDGNDTTGRRDTLALDDYPLPVLTAGYRSLPPAADWIDLALTAAEAPQRVLVHNAVTVKVVVSRHGQEDKTLAVPLTIERAGQVVHTEPLQLPAGVTQRSFAVRFTPTQPGDFVFTARLGQSAGEQHMANNVQAFKLRVDANPIRVLYIEGRLRTEYTFLRNHLADDPDVDLITYVRTANPNAVSATSMLVASELLGRDRLAQLDVILLGDFERTMLDEASYRAIRQWVEDGGGLMVLGGYDNLSSRGLADTPLADLLPVDLLSGAFEQLEEPFNFQLTTDGALHPAMALTGDASRDAALWQSLPALPGVVAVGKPKPAAVVLARHPANRPGLPAGGAPVLTTQPFGKGAVALLTADTTWRWSRIPRLSGRPDTLYVRFWSQMIRWLAKRDIENNRPALWVTTDKAVYDRGQRVGIEIRRNPAIVLPVDNAVPVGVKLTVRWPNGRTTPVSATATSDPNTWAASFFPSRGGRFDIAARLVSADTDAGTADVASQVGQFLVRGSSLEVDDPTTSPQTMRAIARLTGGDYAFLSDTEQMSAMVHSLPTERRQTTLSRKAGVWDSPWLVAVFLVFVSLMTAEWIVRRRNHLV